ncbi:MAG: ATP-dependent DNA helicase RecG [Candidatus Omnitrophica bacterium]|nr:ATP-dependent DNA helicase RecG [Candidatus Omnitrophota bacterium]MBU1924046.1 ATP-dependent DNA helicase RecG [Candidatus Omnitrophota bacterium]
MAQNTSIQYLKGIGPKRAKSFALRGINTIEELLYYFPRRYEDRTNFSNISELKEGDFYTIKTEVLSGGQRNSWRRRAFSITEAALADKTGKINCVWFNQPYLKEYLETGASLILYGKVEMYNGRMQMNNPEFEFIDCEDDDSLNIGRIVPIYTLPQGFSQRSMRQLIKNAIDEFLPKIKDYLPFDLRSRNNLLNLAQSLLNIHFPQELTLQKQALMRLSFEEFFIFQLPLVLRKLRRKEKKGIRHAIDGKLIDDFISGLPFKLTSAQQKVLEEIKTDMASGQAMQRLLQGDVGSGKTVVATLACLIAIQSGYQAAFMVPTEILARQHYTKITAQLAGLVFSGCKIRVGLLTGQDKEKEKIYQEVKEGEINLVIGTHALLQEELRFKALSFTVIDEQHKFGVGQRALLPKKGNNPDVLILTATPIPRTLAITLYGDLDISVINQLPAGRIPVKTLHFSQQGREKGFTIAKEELNYGRQAYIIYPVIEESYALDIAGAKKMFVELREGEFKGFRLGLIHGKLKAKEQQEIMLKFRNKELDLLVSTTILEVGIDIPNATCMIVAYAERFGLSQLHQLRGRIGRGNLQSFCILISDAQTEESRARLQAMVSSSDGFRISEEDLKIRGPGEFFGNRQHGLAELKLANSLTQMQLLKAARQEAIKLLSQDARLEERPHQLLKEKLLQRFPEYEKLMLVG